jgi:hypothetical protein
MNVLDFAALLILIMLTCLIGAFLWFLGALPGRVAKERHHPFEQAITVGGWTTLVLGVVAWPLVLMWAYVPLRPGHLEGLSAGKEDDLRNEIKSLQTQVEKLSKQVQAQGGAKQ